MGTPYTQIDAFTERAFGGNPAPVFVLDAPRGDDWMQSVARELAASETAFLHPQGDGTWSLRWFTPVDEIDLCGHATLAAGHALLEQGLLAEGEAARFDTRSGRLTVTPAGGLLRMDFPVKPLVVEEPSDDLRRAVRDADIVAAGRAEDGAFVLAELADEAAVRAVVPDLPVVAALPAVVGLIVTAASATDGIDFVSRMFGPQLGFDEDPVTGAAHCVLGPYWMPRVGRSTMVGAQVSARGGIVEVEVRGDRVVLGGRAVTVARGEMLV